MKKRMGFTLIELLAVIVVIGLIALIAIPAISKVINKSERDTLQIQENLFLEAGINYFLDKMATNEISMNKYEVQNVNLETLIDLGYIKPIKDPNTDLYCNANSSVEAAYAGGRIYDYAAYFICGDYQSVKNVSHFKMVDYKFLKGAMDYMSANPGQLPSAVGDRATITYNTLKAGNFISALYDVTSENECSTNSKVVVEKNNNGYDYLSGLICDNYLRTEAWEILKNNDFTNGTNDWSISSGNIINTNNNVATFIATSQNGKISQSTMTITTGHKYYALSEFKSDSSLVQSELYLKSSSPTILGTSSGNENFEKKSVIAVAGSNATIQFNVIDTRTSSWTNISVKKFILIDITNMYGSGNEPTLSQMDAMIENSGY